MRQVKAKLDRKSFTRSLKRCWKAFLKQAGKCRKSRSTEAVHQLRVSSRRLLAQLQILRATVPRVKSAKAERVLKRFRRKLGDLRDTQVQSALLASWCEQFPALHAVRESLEVRENRLLKMARRDVKELECKKLRKYLAGIKAELGAGLKDPAPRDLASDALGWVHKAYTQTVRRLKAINYARPETIHRARIAFKKFRYTMESIPDSVTGLTKAEKQELSAYQDRMGKIQDLEVLDQMIASFEETHPDDAKSTIRFRRHLKAQRAKALAEFKRSSGDLLHFWPPISSGTTRSASHQSKA